MRYQIPILLFAILLFVHTQALRAALHSSATNSSFLSLLHSEKRCHAPDYDEIPLHYPACKDMVFSALARFPEPSQKTLNAALAWYWGIKSRVSANEMMQRRLINQMQSPIFDAIFMEERYLQSAANFESIQNRIKPRRLTYEATKIRENYQSIEELLALVYHLPAVENKYAHGWLHQDRLYGSAARLLDKSSELNRLIGHVIRSIGLDKDGRNLRDTNKPSILIPDNPAFWDTLHNKIYRVLFSGRENWKALVAKLEGQVSQLSVLYKKWLSQSLTVTDVSQILHSKVFIEYLRYQNQANHQDHYAAFTLYTHSHRPILHFADLGRASIIDELILQARHQILSKQDFSAIQQQLAKHLIEPLKIDGHESIEIVISPVGSLSTLPFSLILDPDNERNLFVSYGNSESIRIQLFWQQSGLKNITTTTPGIVLSNPDYGGDLTTISPDLQVAGLERDGDSHWPRYFTPLAYTAREARAITRLSPNKVIVQSGRHASEFALFEHNHPKFIHIASHGYFLSDDWQLRTSKMRASIPGDYSRPVLRQLNAGIALADANQLVSHQPVQVFHPDGLFTVMDASSLNLLGTELVVLSACNTGLSKNQIKDGYGGVEVGDGAISLRSAFQMAGANNVIMSLWPVADKSTSWLMEEFYRAWFSGLPPQQALQLAKANLRKRLRKQGMPVHPYYWAGFVIQTDF